MAWLGGQRAERNVLITVNGERIANVEIGGDRRPSDPVVLPGLTLPGFANAHSHAFHRALRGRTHHGNGSFWTWREAMYDLATSLDPDRYFHLARAVYGEMVLAGISAVGEFHYLHHGQDGVPYEDPNAMGNALIEAAREAGIRITLLDTCYLHGGIGCEPDETQRRFSDGDAERWALRAEALRGGPGARIGAAIHSVRAVDPAAITTVAQWASVRGAPLHAHVSEQPAENEQCVDAFGATPTELLERAGALSDRFTAVHATHVSESDVGRLGDARCWCCFCPTTERDLADGIGPARALRDRGARLTLGSDSQAVIDPLEESRAVELNARLATGVRGAHDAPAMLQMATEHGHTSLGWPQAGRLEAGALADMVTVGLDSVRTVGATADNALETAVFAATASDVRHVVVGGRVVVEHGRHRTIDVPAALGDALGVNWA
ncbi:MAG: formimidoylglutamate deiminase [Actinomycetota bacterium]|nr:formimidoylglutamate deiminase [Actinomycetota bacterium]